jgi:hypothetical protein
MKRILASSLGMTLGLLASTGRADNVTWRAARGRTPSPTPATPATTPRPPHPQSGVVLASHVAREPDSDIRPALATEPAAFEPAVAENTPSARVRAQGTDEAPSAPPVAPARATVSRPACLPDPSAPVYSPPAAYGAVVGSPALATAPACNGVYPEYIVPCSPLLQEYVRDGRAPRLQVSAEYLFWWVKGADGPPLVTTSPPGMNGILPGATVLVSVPDLDRQYRPGGRFGLVYWFDDCASWGFDGRYFFTGERTGSFAANSDQFPNLFRPFFAANVVPPLGLPGEFSEQVTAAGVTTGSVRADLRSRFWGAEANYRDNLCCWSSCTCGFRLDLLAGFRYLNLDEDLTVVEDFTRLVPSQQFPDEVAGTRVVITDRFATDNDFYGGQLGTVMEYRRNRWTLDLRTAVALGVTNQQLTIEGNQVRSIPGQPPLNFQGGLLALNSNIGQFSRDVFSVVPEVGVNVGYQVTDHLRAYVGYNFLYWSNVIRPGDQIDRVIDVNRVPRFAPPGVPDATTIRPAVLFRETDFWAQGVNVGMEYRW